MDNSSRRQSASSSINSDPFRDPVVPPQTDQPAQRAPSRIPNVPAPYQVVPPSVINTSLVREREVPRHRHQHQLRHALPSIQIDIDAILPVWPGFDATSPNVHYDPPRNGVVDSDVSSTNSTSALSELVTRRVAGEPINRSPEIVKKGKRKIIATKWIFIIILLSVK